MRFFALAIVITLAISAVPSPSHAGPVTDAALAGDLETVKRLIGEGGDVNEPGIAGPLYFAIQRGHSDVAKLLIEQGADVNSLSKWGAPLHIAARKGDAETVALLLANGADPSVKGGEDEWTPLHHAAVSGSIETASHLLQHGADVNAETRWLEPPVHFAVLKERNELATFLQENGASPPDVKPISLELAAADLETGRLRAIECGQCHKFEPGQAAEGPSLWDVVGRPKASLPDYPYSSALMAAGGTWGFEDLNRFLAHTTRTIPGTSMDHGFEPDGQKRINLIAFLRTLSRSPVPLP